MDLLRPFGNKSSNRLIRKIQEICVRLHNSNTFWSLIHSIILPQYLPAPVFFLLAAPHRPVYISILVKNNNNTKLLALVVVVWSRHEFGSQFGSDFNTGVFGGKCSVVW